MKSKIMTVSDIKMRWSAIILLLGVIAHANEPNASVGSVWVEMPSGERLLGEIVAYSDTAITLKSALLGQMVLPAAGAKVLPIVGGDLAQLKMMDSTTAPKDMVPSDKSKEVAIAPVASEKIVRPPVQIWHKDVELGLSFNHNQTSRTDIYTMLGASRPLGDHQFKIWGRYRYGESAGMRNEDRIEVGSEVSRGNWMQKFGLRYSGVYIHDDLNRLGDDFTLSGTALFSPLTTDRFYFGLGPGLASRYVESSPESEQWNLLTTLNGEMGWRWKKLAVAGSFMAGAPIETNGWNHFIFKSKLELSGRLSESLKLILRYEHEYDHAIDPLVGRSTERIYQVITYEF